MRQRGGGRVSLHPNLRSPCGHLNWIRLDFYLGSDLIDWVLNHFSPKGDSSAVTSFQSEIQNPKVSEPGNRIQQRGGIYRLHRIFFFADRNRFTFDSFPLFGLPQDVMQGGDSSIEASEEALWGTNPAPAPESLLIHNQLYLFDCLASETLYTTHLK